MSDSDISIHQSFSRPYMHGHTRTGKGQRGGGVQSLPWGRYAGFKHGIMGRLGLGARGYLMSLLVCLVWPCGSQDLMPLHIFSLYKWKEESCKLLVLDLG